MNGMQCVSARLALQRYRSWAGRAVSDSLGLALNWQSLQEGRSRSRAAAREGLGLPRSQCGHLPVWIGSLGSNQGSSWSSCHWCVPEGSWWQGSYRKESKQYRSIREGRLSVRDLAPHGHHPGQLCIYPDTSWWEMNDCLSLTGAVLATQSWSCELVLISSSMGCFTSRLHVVVHALGEKFVPDIRELVGVLDGLWGEGGACSWVCPLQRGLQVAGSSWGLANSSCLWVVCSLSSWSLGLGWEHDLSYLQWVLGLNCGFGSPAGQAWGLLSPCPQCLLLGRNSAH